MERQRPFQREGFTDDEADAIVRRAVELQQQAAPGGRIRPRELEESAEVAGVAPEFVQQAISELRAKQATTQRARPAPIARPLLALLAGLIAFGVALLLTYLLVQAPGGAQRVPATATPAPVVRPVEVEPPAPPAPPARPAPPAPPTRQ